MAQFYIFESVNWDIQLVNEDENSHVLDNIKNVVISIRQQNTLLEKDSESGAVGIDAENDVITVALSQEETGSFTAGKQAIIQVNLLYNDTERDTTCQDRIEVLDNLHKQVMV